MRSVSLIKGKRRGPDGRVADLADQLLPLEVNVISLNQL